MIRLLCATVCAVAVAVMPAVFLIIYVRHQLAAAGL